MGETVHESGVGPVVDVVTRSRAKPLIASLIWVIPGAILFGGGIWMVAYELNRSLSGEGSIEGAIAVIGAVIIVVGWVLWSTIIRRWRASADERVYLRAGPGGVSVGHVGFPRILRLLTSYRILTSEFAWDQVKTWYPHVIRVNGIPTESTIEFVGNDGWQVSVNTLYFSGGRESIAQAVAAAMERSDLLPGGPPPAVAEDEEPEESDGCVSPDQA